MVGVGLVGGERVLVGGAGRGLGLEVGHALLHLAVLQLVVEVAVGSPGRVAHVEVLQNLVVVLPDHFHLNV